MGDELKVVRPHVAPTCRDNPSIVSCLGRLQGWKS
jgi:hypothetical protein